MDLASPRSAYSERTDVSHATDRTVSLLLYSSTLNNTTCARLGWLEPWRTPQDCLDGGLALADSLSALFSGETVARRNSIQYLYGDTADRRKQSSATFSEHRSRMSSRGPPPPFLLSLGTQGQSNSFMAEGGRNSVMSNSYGEHPLPSSTGDPRVGSSSCSSSNAEGRRQRRIAEYIENVDVGSNDGSGENSPVSQQREQSLSRQIGSRSATCSPERAAENKKAVVPLVDVALSVPRISRFDQLMQEKEALLKHIEAEGHPHPRQHNANTSIANSDGAGESAKGASPELRQNEHTARPNYSANNSYRNDNSSHSENPIVSVPFSLPKPRTVGEDADDAQRSRSASSFLCGSDVEREEEYDSARNYGEGGHYACVPGVTLHNRYLLMRKLGTGRSSTVWLAVDRDQCNVSRRHLIHQLGEDHVRRLFKPEENPLFVAVKIFRCGEMYTECAEYETAVLRYLKEQRDEVPWFARITVMRERFTVDGEFGLHHCIVMDVVGSGVDAAINETELAGLPMEVSQTILTTALQGLASLAALNIIHSDIKPENLLFTDLDPAVAADMALYQETHLRTSAGGPLWSNSKHRRMSVADYAARRAASSASSHTYSPTTSEPLPDEGLITDASGQRAFFDVQVSDLGLSFLVPLALRGGPEALAELGGDGLLDLTPNAQLEEITQFLSGAVLPSFVTRRSPVSTSSDAGGFVSVNADTGGTRAFVSAQSQLQYSPRPAGSATNLPTGPSFEKLRALIANPPGTCEMAVLRQQNYSRGVLVQSREYRSPEVVLGNYFLPSCDVWSIGCIAYELVMGKFLFDSTTDREESFRERLRESMRKQKVEALRRANGGTGIKSAIRRLSMRLQGTQARAGSVSSSDGGGGGDTTDPDTTDLAQDSSLELLQEEEDEVLEAPVECMYFSDVDKDVDVFHLRSMMRLLGPPPLAYLNRDPVGVYVDNFFDADGTFLFITSEKENAELGYDLIAEYRAEELDCVLREQGDEHVPSTPPPTTGRDPADSRNYPICTPAWSRLRHRLRKKLPTKKCATLFEEFLLKCLQWDPSKRCTAQELLSDPWLCSEE